MGIVAFWALLVLGLSYYARARIGVQRWRRLHRFAALAWLLGLAHSLGEGTDAGQAWFLAMLAIVAAPAIALLLERLLRSTPTAPSRRIASLPASASDATTKPTPAQLTHAPARDEGGAMTTPPPNSDRLHARTLAASRREALRLRARRIRRAVAGLAVTLFATAFLIVYVQLASGHDPALVGNAAKRRATAVSTSRSTPADTSESTSGESAGDPAPAAIGRDGESASASSGESGAGSESSASGESGASSESDAGERTQLRRFARDDVAVMSIDGEVERVLRLLRLSLRGARERPWSRRVGS